MSKEMPIPEEIQSILQRLNKFLEWEENLSPEEEDRFARLLAQYECGDIIITLEDGTKRRDPPGPHFEDYQIADRLGFDFELDLKKFRFIAKPSKSK
jgi:hypothetical protein